MPGIAGAFWGRGPEGMVRAAVTPLVRRPWHEPMFVVDPGGRAAFGVVGEQSGVVASADATTIVAFDGELFLDGGIVAGERAASLILAGYRDAGVRLVPPDGSFAAVIWDTSTDTLVALTDRLGQRSLYLTRTGEAVLVASELKSLVAAGLSPALDLDAWAQILAYEHPLGESTPLAGVRLVPAGTALAISSSPPRETEHRYFRYRIEPETGAGTPELVEELGRLLERALSRRLDGGPGLALSGGLDSRCLAIVARQLAPETMAVTYGAHRSEDFRFGARVARLVGLPHVPLELSAGYIAAGASETVWLGEGHVRSFHAHSLALQRLRNCVLWRSLLFGFSGDAVLRTTGVPLEAQNDEPLAAILHRGGAACVSDALAEELLTTSFASSIRGRAAEALARHIAEEDGTVIARVKQFRLRHTLRRMVLPSAELFRDDFAARDVFADADLVEFCRRLPDAHRVDGALQREFLRGHAPTARIRSPKDGVAPAATGLRLRVDRLGVRARRRARAELESILGHGRIPRHRGIGDYASDLRHSGRDLLSILLEPRTLARGQLREESVRRLVEETLSGRGRHTRALGALLTLELFQRQFIEQDAPGPVEPPNAGPELVATT
jgi:asparagine synthase/glutamine amidotransferase-like protein